VKDTLKKKNPSLSFGVALAPQESTTAPAVNFANYWGQVVSKQSKNSEMAWKFLQFATAKDNLSKYLAVAKQPSSRKDLLEAQTSDPEIGTFAHAVASAKSFFRPHSEDIDKVFSGAIDAVIFKGSTPVAAVAQALRQAQSLLQKKN
jgi:ABC-type glycerol-3-phosphate transport system substrate-binding protein